MKNMKKVFAFVLALAMILTTYQPTTTYAATKAPTISAKKMTLQVGSKKTLTVKKAGKNATLKWSSNKKTVATVSKKGVVKAVKAGTANVKCKVVTKSKKHYTLTCKVTVKNAAVSKTVSTQKALTSALKDKNVKNLTIKTDKEVAFNIPSGNYGKVNLTVDAPNADVVNAGTFKSINIKAIKPNTWKEKAKGNTITVTADDARIVVEAGASLSKVTVSQEGGKIKIEAAGTIDAIQIDAAVDVSLAVDGTVGEVAVSAPAKVAVEGKTTTAIPVKVEETAKGADVTSSTPVEVKAATEISLNLSKGAEGSKVETTGENAQVAVKNDTADVIKVTTPAGTKEVAKDTTSKVDNTGKVTDTTTNTNGDNNGGSTGGGSTSGGGSSSGGSTGGDVTPAETVTIHPSVISQNEIEVDVPGNFLNKDNVTVKKENGTTALSISKVVNNDSDDEKLEDSDDRSYTIFLGENCEDNQSYVVTTQNGNTKYEGTFKFSKSDVEATDKEATDVRTAFEGQTYEMPKNAKNNIDLCKAMLQSKVNAYASENGIWARLFECSTVNEDDFTSVNVTIRVSEGYAIKDIVVNVKLTFTEESISIKKPVIVKQLKNSIIVKAEAGQEYTCVESGKQPTDDDYWYDISDADELGNIEMDELDTDKEYVVYTRISGTDEFVKSDSTILLKSEDPAYGAIIDAPNKNLTGTVTEDKGRSVLKVPMNTVVRTYGDWEGLDGSGDIKCDNPYFQVENGFDWCDLDYENGKLYVEFYNLENVFGVGNHNFDFTYVFVVNNEPMKQVEYNVSFQFTDKDVPNLEIPEVKYQLQNSIVISAESNQVYACVPSGTSIMEAKDLYYGLAKDSFGYIEIKGLEMNQAYDLYTWGDGKKAMAKKCGTYTLTGDNQKYVCVAATDGKTNFDLSELVTANQEVVVTLEGLKMEAYGITEDEEGNWPHGNLIHVSPEKLYWKFTPISDDENDSVSVVFTPSDGGQWTKGPNTINFSYVYEHSDIDAEVPDAQSTPIEYTVRFTAQ